MTSVRRSDVILLVDLTDRIKDEFRMDRPEAVDLVHACLPAAMRQIQFWILPTDGGSPYVSDGDPSVLISIYARWKSQCLLRMVPVEPWERRSDDPIREMALLRDDAEDLVQRVREHVGAAVQVVDALHGYLDPSHPRYAPKLAAAVRAWQSVTDTSGTSAKQALADWLRAHSKEFELSKEGVEECSKVANWNPSGGAPKTP